MKKILDKISWTVLKNLLFPLSIFSIFLASYIFYKVKIASFLPIGVHQNLKKHIIAIFIVCIAFTLQRFSGAVLNWYRDNIALKTETHLDDEFIPLMRRTIKVLIWMIAFLVILPFYGVNISALVTTLGVSSLAIALAAQDTISNIIAGFMIMVDRPFITGDRIKLSTGETVIVHDIGIRRSKFLLNDKAILIVPNMDLSRSRIVNYTYGEERLNKTKDDKVE